MSLPKSKNKFGYTREEIESICEKRKIFPADLWQVFGVNTCSIDKKGNSLFYKCDIERALDILGHKDGKYHQWD